ncbi:hypothetical protein Hanom_Chr02g00116741 [Helianthus anomalus]
MILKMNWALISVTSSSNPTKSPSSSLSSTSLTTAHSVFTHHGFPIGLLPTGDFSYNLNTTTGELSVDLETPAVSSSPLTTISSPIRRKSPVRSLRIGLPNLRGLGLGLFPMVGDYWN